MTQFDLKLMSIQQAVRAIPEGALVALGGSNEARQPMAIVREIVRQRKTLRLAGYRYGIDFDMLLRAGCAATLDVPLSNEEADQVKSLAASVGSTHNTIGADAAFARFEAGAAGLPYAIVKSAVEAGGSEALLLRDAAGKAVAAIPGLTPDIAIIHAHAADIYGNVLMDLESRSGFARDLVLARSAAQVIASVEQVVSPQTVANAPAGLVLSANRVSSVVEAPYGAYPTQCERRYDSDGRALAAYREAVRDTKAFDCWLATEVLAVNGHAAYLDRLGMERLMTATTKRSA